MLRVRPTAAKKDEGKPSSLEDALLSTHEVDKDTLETVRSSLFYGFSIAW